jgi:hypothetical protein
LLAANETGENPVLAARVPAAVAWTNFLRDNPMLTPQLYL